MTKRYQQNFFRVFLFFLLLLSPLISSLATQESIDITLKRTFGTAFGSYIQGTFTIEASGSDNILNLTLLLNSEEIFFENGNSLSYRFKTNEFKPGELNITVLGYASSGELYFASKYMTILSPIVSILITLGIILLVVGTFAWKYGPRIKSYFQKKKDINGNKELSY